VQLQAGLHLTSAHVCNHTFPETALRLLFDALAAALGALSAVQALA
jgi:hypothetical protein